MNQMEYNGHFNKEDYIRRIRVLRRYKDMNQTEFAKFLDVPYKKWNHYERGFPLPRETVFILYDKVPEITPWWVWFGDQRGLDATVIKRLQELEQEEKKRTRRLDTGKPLATTPVKPRLSRTAKRR